MRISKIEPPFWYIGLEALFDRLQVMVCGDDLAGATVETTLPHSGPVTTEEGVDAHYLMVYVTVDPRLLEVGMYTFTLTKGGETRWFNYEIRARVANAGGRLPLTPADVVYLLMPDRFARGGKLAEEAGGADIDRTNPNGWHGGNLKGIADHLDYLADLGVTALWLTPVHDNGKHPGKPSPEEPSKDLYTSYHGYAITDFYQVDSHFGHLDDFCDLVRNVHGQGGMKVVMDLVLNHCGSRHPWLQRPPMRDWFNATDYAEARHTNYRLTTVLDPHRAETDVEDTVRGWFTSQMPDLNMDNPHLFQYLTQMSVWWVETTGVDAVRVDTYPYVSLSHMKAWQEKVHAVLPTLSIVAETWVAEAAFTSEVQRRNSDGDHTLIVMDFAFQTHLHEAILGKRRHDAALALYNHFAYDFLYRDASQTLAFLDNHDLWRWGYLCPDPRRAKQGIGILLTVPRIPQLLYGTELLLAGTGDRSDGAFRQDFPGGWSGDAVDKFTPEGRTSEEADIFDFTRRLLRWRKESGALTRGRMTHYIPQDGLYVYFRSYRHERVMVIVNTTGSPKRLPLSRYRADLAGRTLAADIPTSRWFDLAEADIPLRKNDILILQLT